MPGRFVILAAPRCGSNWLCSLLDSHPEILCHHELFNPQGIHLSRSLRHNPGVLGSTALQKKAPLEWLAQAWTQSFGFHTVGFKLNLGQSALIFDNVLNDSGVKKIIISRRNRIRSYLSETTAEKTGIWESFPESTPARRPGPQPLDVADLQNRVQRNREYYDALRTKLARSAQSALELEYETLGNKKQHRLMLNYLEVDPNIALETATSRMSRGSLRSRIRNFEQLERELAGTDLEQDLSDGERT